MEKSLLIICSLFFLGMGTGEAQYTDLLNFNYRSSPFGSSPGGSLTLSGGILYGMAPQGGAAGFGCAFSVDTNGNNYKDLHDFTGFNGVTMDGTDPTGALTLSGKVLYGMTAGGGSAPGGTIFSIDTDGSGYKLLYIFNGTLGDHPQGALTIAGNMLYGMAGGGGAQGSGCVFSIDTNGNNYKDLFNFTGTNNYGYNPSGSLTLSGKALYGMSYKGGANDSGCIFSIDTNGSNYKDLFDFNGTNGKWPGGLILSGEVLYGTTYGGGANKSGCAFSIDTNGNGYKILLNYNNTNITGSGAQLALSGNLLYGMSPLGGSNKDGCIYSLDTKGNGYKDLFDFNNTNGGYPGGTLTLSKGIMYGMTSQGGNGNGVIFSFKDANVTNTNNLTAIKGSVTVSPNPSNGIFNVVCHPELVSGSQTMTVYNILGEQVYNATLNQAQGDNRINLSGQPSGIYLYRVTANSGELIGEGKLVIQK